MCVCVYVCTCARVCICVCMRVCACVCVCADADPLKMVQCEFLDPKFVGKIACASHRCQSPQEAAM